MNTKEALSIIVELAEQNLIEEGDEVLKEEAKIQRKALRIVKKLLRGIC